MTLSVVETENLAATLPLTPTSLPIGAEDSLRFSFEIASGVRGDSGDGSSSSSAPVSHAPKVANESPTSTRIPSSANSLL